MVCMLTCGHICSKNIHIQCKTYNEKLSFVVTSWEKKREVIVGKGILESLVTNQ